MEAELFGYERGAFTDAKESKLGLFEAAEGGFIFLDEIGDVELALQGKLLRAIEDRVVRRVGGIRDRKIDVRIVSATNRDLEREVERDQFRRDLYFRLAVILLRLPPLRERGDDVLLLADHYLHRLAAKYGKDVRRISAEAQHQMLSYPWPGNVRELSHVIERAVLWSRGQELTPEHLALTQPGGPIGRRSDSVAQHEDRAPIAPPPAGPDAEPPSRPAAEQTPPEGVTLDQWERTLLERALAESAGNQTRAAQRLGITRDTLRYRMKKHGLGGG